MVEAELLHTAPQVPGGRPAKLRKDKDTETQGPERYPSPTSPMLLSGRLPACQADRMPIVLVHGVPETPAVWEHLRSELSRSDVVTPQLPGFGCPRPAGFGATKEEYVQWLVSELEALAAQGPIDLVGHDWGGGFVVRVVSTRPDLVRSWVTDAAAIGDVNFEWHDFAKIWQTPGEGEQFFEQQLATSPEERGSVFEMFGVPR